MAVDTAEKRYSMMNIPVVGASMILFVATGAIDAPEREHLLGLYAGFAITPAVEYGEYVYFARHRVRR